MGNPAPPVLDVFVASAIALVPLSALLSWWWSDTWPVIWNFILILLATTHSPMKSQAFWLGYETGKNETLHAVLEDIGFPDDTVKLIAAQLQKEWAAQGPGRPWRSTTAITGEVIGSGNGIGDGASNGSRKDTPDPENPPTG